ncbi:MAG: Hsp20/alpha crystallin family protein [Deltaproteobacteria bacterium]|nr:Hsp20/alpha crystallin family protein [Deltaproteobacteria bacterium]
MNLIRYAPAGLFNTAFERMFDDFWGQTPAEHTAETASFHPRVDIRDEKESIVINTELPGVEKDKISVKVENDVLTLSGEKKNETTHEENDIYRSERTFGTFTRSFKLPEVVNPEKIEAQYHNGVLKLVLPKRPEAAPRNIEVKVLNGDAKKIGVN